MTAPFADPHTQGPLMIPTRPDPRELALDALRDARIEASKDNHGERSHLLAEAQVHAVLALVDALSPNPAPTGPGRVEFHDGTVVAYTPPDSTLDPRYKACTRHRVACDCREAEHAEERKERQAEQSRANQMIDAGKHRIAQVVDEVIDGHPFVCACHGCEIARRLRDHGYVIASKDVPF